LSNKDLNYFFFKINNILNNDGLVIINVPSLSFLYSNYDKAVGHHKRYHIDDFYNLSKKFRFEIVNVSYWGLFYIPLLLFRKFYLFFLPSKNIVEFGFNAKSRLFNCLLYKLYALDSLFSQKGCMGSVIEVMLLILALLISGYIMFRIYKYQNI
jgi:hypothetical protein